MHRLWRRRGWGRGASSHQKPKTLSSPTTQPATGARLWRGLFRPRRSFSQPHPLALSYHNTFRNIYSTTPIHPSTHIPGRDVITENYVMVEEGVDALIEAYPEAQAIRDAAGSKLIV